MKFLLPFFAIFLLTACNMENGVERCYIISKSDDNPSSTVEEAQEVQ